MKIQSQEQKFLYNKREKRRLQNIAAERTKRKKLAKLQDWPLIYTPQTLKILQKNIPQGIYPGKNISERITIPRNFSIVDDPENALKTIYQLVAFSSRRRPPREIFFDHSALTNFDLAAEEILDVVALDFKRIRKRAKGGLQLRGRFPFDSSADRFIKAVGIIKSLNLTSRYLRKEDEQELKILRFLSYRALLRALEESPSERAARKLVDYFNECLEVIGRQLTVDGRHYLSIYAGEVLDNAIEHSGTHDWVLAGYLDLDTPERICEISIFNFGLSFAETFANLSPEHFTRQYVDPFVAIHKKKGLFQSGWEPENLLSVIALQGQISSKNHSSQDIRGNGTIDLMTFFQKVYRETSSRKDQAAKMVIISGKTYILFDGKYKMSPDKEGRQIIAFNSRNDLRRPPAQTHVKCLKGVKFPGTIVSIRFPLPRIATQDVIREQRR